MTAPAYLFRPDVTGEPGYRPRCLECGRERAGHTAIPRPRTHTRQQDEIEEERDE